MRRRGGQVREDGALLVGELARHAVDDTQGADAGTVTQAQGHSGIKTDVRIAGHQCVIGKPAVCQCVRYLHEAIVQNRMATKGQITRRLGDAGQTKIGLEPLPLGVDQAYQGNRDATDQRCSLDDGVKLRLGRGIQYRQRGKRMQPCRFVVRNSCARHSAPFG